MSVTVDRQPFATMELGLQTVGEVLSHLQRDNRLVVQVLVDGEQPQIGQLRQTQLAGRTIFIETADPRTLALQVLDAVAEELEQAERFKTEAADLLQRGLTPKALEQLSACIRTWQRGQESILKTAELLRIDLANVIVEDRPLEAVLADFSAQLRQVKTALEQRDFVSLADVLLYETAATSQQWLAAVAALRQIIASLR